MTNRFHPIDYPRVVERLVADYGFRRSNKHLTQGRCPECGKKELYSHIDRPYLIKCNRTNNCGYEDTIKDIYPDLFEHFTKKYPPTETDPNHTATQYLAIGRGLDTSKMKGWYEQGVIYDTEKNLTTATVKFWLNKEKGIFWERLIDYTGSEQLGRKARFIGAFGGSYWAPPAQKHLDPERPLYIVEGIFDAIALWLSGVQVASAMTSHNFPLELINKLDKKQTVIWALDNNSAGIDFGKKYVERSRELGFDSFLAIPNTKRDWNDIYNLGGAEALEKTLAGALWHGAALHATNAADTASIYIAQNRMPYRIFQKNHAYWEYKYDHSKLEKMIGDKDDPEQMEMFFKRSALDLIRDDKFLQQIKAATKVKKISNCIAKFEYQQVDQYNDQDRLNYFEIEYENGSPKSTISIPGASLADAGTFNQALLRHTPGARFTGGKNHLEYLHEKVWFYKPAKEVKTLNFVGYDKKSGAYVFDKVAFLKGKRTELNKQGFFDLKDAAIKTVNKDIRLNIAKDFDSNKFMHHFQAAYGSRGLIVLSWWIGSLFAEQIRERFQGYPFFELQGQASSGKSTLIKILWKLLGREEYEGFNPLNSSFSAIDRNFAKTANLPVILIESDANDEQRNARKFNWEHLKNAYTGEPLKERGAFNSGNETVFNPFRASLMAAQNTPIDGSEAILSRFVHLPLDRTHHLPNGKFHAETLALGDVEEMSGFLPYMLKFENKFLQAIFARQPEAYKEYDNLGITIDRIKDNHALLQAILETLTGYLPMNAELVAEAIELLHQRAAKRQVDTQADHPEVQKLWDIYEYANIQGGDDQVFAKQSINHHSQPGLIAINLVHFEQVCKDAGVRPPEMAEVKRHFRATHRHRFIEHKAVHSAIFGRTVRCYVFEDKSYKGA